MPKNIIQLKYRRREMKEKNENYEILKKVGLRDKMKGLL